MCALGASGPIHVYQELLVQLYIILLCYVCLLILLMLYIQYICYCCLITVSKLPQLLCLHPNYSDECFLASYEVYVLCTWSLFSLAFSCLKQPTHTLGHNGMPTSPPPDPGGSGSFYLTRQSCFISSEIAGRLTGAAESKHMEALVGCAR